MPKDNKDKTTAKKKPDWIAVTCLELSDGVRVDAGKPVNDLSAEDVRILKKLKAIKKPD